MWSGINSFLSYIHMNVNLLILEHKDIVITRHLETDIKLLMHPDHFLLGGTQVLHLRLKMEPGPPRDKQLIVC